ncbi:MAG: DUF2384 domain-containing protein [Abyssibacter sp.]|nr:antitoxin Xre/MbcA/ParS toxin-binding domain-containing protein [Abyssibacter sp.]MCK5860680.1 DUF2384 domain-containing protein [Abyssibacter sp.]
MKPQSTILAVVNLLGLQDGASHGYSRMWLRNQLSEGLPLSAYDRLTKKVCAGDPTGAHLIISGTKIKRRRRDKKRLSPEDSQKLERLARAWAMAMDVYKSERHVRHFLNTPHMMLHSETPLSVAISNDVGAHAVENLLGRLKYGSAA